MEIGIGVGVLLIAAAFCILVLYCIRVLQSVRLSLDQANRTLSELKTQVESVSTETVTLLRNTNSISTDVQTKLKQLDAAFTSVSEVGNAVHEVTSSIKQASATVSKSVRSSVEGAVHRHQNRLAEAVDWVTLGLQAWAKIQEYRKSSNPKGADQHVEQ